MIFTVPWIALVPHLLVLPRQPVRDPVPEHGRSLASRSKLIRDRERWRRAGRNAVVGGWLGGDWRVGEEAEAPQRVVVPVAFLGHAHTEAGAAQEARKEYDFVHQVVFVVPCACRVAI
jgi:hypothetical protein